MNKKFSTLATAGLLLSGALFCNVNAKDVVAGTALAANALNGASDDKEVVLASGEYATSGSCFLITEPGTVIIGVDGTVIKSHLVINAENVTVKGVKFLSTSTGSGYWQKNSITAFADEVSIEGNEFTLGSIPAGNVANGIVVFPKGAENANYTIAGNKFTGFNVKTSTNETSTTITIHDDFDLKVKTGDPVYDPQSAGNIADQSIAPVKGGLDSKAITEKNEFSNCYTDYIYQTDDKYAYVHVSTVDVTTATPNAIIEAVQYSKADGSSTVATTATLAQVKTIMALNGAPAAIQNTKVPLVAKDAVVLFGDAKAPAGVNLPVEVVTSDGSSITYAPVAKASKFSLDKYYVLFNATNGNALKYKDVSNAINAEVVPYDRTNSTFFWAFEKVETSATTGYAKLKNSNGEYLVDANSKYLVVKLSKTANGWEPTMALSVLAFSEVETGTANTTLGSAFTLGEIGTTPLTSTQLKSIYGDSFEAELLYDKKPLAGNPFTGVLKPVVLRSGVAYPIYNTSSSYMLQNEAGNIIVIRLDQKYSVGTGVYGYKVTEMTPRDLTLALADDAANYACMFSIYAWDNFKVGVDQQVARIAATTVNGLVSYDLGSLEVEDELTLAAEQSGADVLNAISIKLGKFNKIDVKKLLAKQAFYTVKNINKLKNAANYGKVLGLDANGNIAFVKSEEALVDQPETQFAITYNTTTKVLTFKNREYPGAVNANDVDHDGFLNDDYIYSAEAIYNTNVPNVYAIGNDTLMITAITDYDPADGYERLDADKLRDQLYYLGIQSSVWDGIAYTVENHKENHQIGLDTDKDVATEWHLAADRFIKKNVLGEDEINRPDTIQIPSTLGYFKADGTYTTTNDAKGKPTVFLKVLSYSLMNQANNEYLRYNDTKDVTRYTTGLNNNEGNVANAQGFNPNYFALKIVGKNADDKTLYNLVKVADRAKDVEGAFEWNYKVYGAGSREKGLLNRTGMYNQIENDLFVVEEKDAPEYVKLNQGDTIKIFRAETESEVLYQKGEFLGMGNAIEFNKINPALYVDTVYYNRDANNRWEYLLGINVTRIDTTYKCNVPSHGIHQADTTYGAFLVNYADSAIVEDTRDIHTNKYVYDNGFRYAKLGFEEGFRTNDTLYVARADGKFDKIEVGAPSRQLVKFAFRVMDHDANTFIVETGYKYPQDVDHSNEPATGYLRWINGNVVVTPNMEDAEVFKLKADDRNPVANEDLTASSVAVIAGEGQITVNGAAGKVVTITNVLGQAIANSVISSDNATIAAPAGVVIVSVEGEAAVKAIVK